MGEPGAITLSGCTFIRSIILHNITEIGEKAFYNCRNLETVIIPETVTKICPEAFAWSRLKSITLLDGRLTEIGENAFHHCGNLETVVIPDSVTKIGPGAF
jgi:BspA type Leucine rich repeat region (6 copies)